MVLTTVALALVAVTATLALSRAEQNITRATRSYEQLAIVTSLEADIGRLLIAEMARIVEGGTGTSDVGANAADRADPDLIRHKIDQLIVWIETEVAESQNEAERRAEREEFAAAHALRALFNSMEHGIDRERRRVSRLDTGTMTREFVRNVIANDYDHLKRIVRAVVLDEREEVRSAIEDMARLKTTLSSALGLAVLLAALLAALSAIVTNRYLMAPVAALMDAATALAQGESGASVAPTGPRELATLAHGFNEMSARLHEQRTELIAVNARLEAAVAERTFQLQAKAQRLAEIDANRRLFFAKVGHELRTPLTALLGEAELALRQAAAGPAEAARDSFIHILAQGEALKRRITDLLTLARSEDGRLSLERRPAELGVFLTEAIEATRAYARICEVTIHLGISEAAATMIDADAERLVQALLALLDNAIKFSPPQGHVTVSVARETDRISIRVEDCGPGVADGEIDRLFHPYEQSEGGRQRAGTGLGLSVARWIVEQHGGRIFAENRTEPRGFRVTIELPHLDQVAS